MKFAVVVLVHTLVNKVESECLIRCSLMYDYWSFFVVMHNSLLVCMVGITYVYIDRIFVLY